MSEYWIEVEEGTTGERVAVIRTATAWESTRLQDRAGNFRFTLPAGDPGVDALRMRRVVRCRTIIDDEVVEIGNGVIENIGMDSANDGALLVTVSGNSLLRELTWQSVGDLVLMDDVIEHASRVWVLDALYYGTPNYVHEVTEALDYQVGDTTTYWAMPTEWNQDHTIDFLYIGHWRTFDTLYFTRGPNGPAYFGTAPWRVQYYNYISGGWEDLSLITKTTEVPNLVNGPMLLGQTGVISWEMPDNWGLQNPLYEIRIFTDDPAVSVHVEIADIAVGYKRPTRAGLERIMACAPPGWALDVANGYTETQPETVIGVDLVANGGWEDYVGTADDGITDNFADWTSTGTDSGNRIEATAVAYSGGTALKIVAATSVQPIIRQDIAVSARTEYTLSFWTRGDGVSESVWRLSDAGSGVTLTGWRYTGCTAIDWVHVSQRFTVPPNVTGIRLEFSATAGVAYVDDVVLVEVSGGEVYLEFAGESVLEGLNRLAEQTGEHFIESPTSRREVLWLGNDRRTLAIWASNGGDANAKQDNAHAAHIISLREEQDGFDLVSRVYPYGGLTGENRLTLAGTTRNAPSGYALNRTENYIERIDADYRRVDRILEFPDIMPWDAGESAVADAANMLYDRALFWLQTHSASNLARIGGDQPRAFTMTISGCRRVIMPGHLIRVTYVEAAETHIMQYVDDTLWVTGATARLDMAGVLAWDLQVATVDALLRTDAEAQIGEVRINRILRRRSPPALSAGSAGIILPGATDHGALVGLADDDHAQYLLANGSRVGAQGTTQGFTNGIELNKAKVPTDKVGALNIYKADGSTIALSLDTTANVQLGIGTSNPSNAVHAIGTVRATQGFSGNPGTIGSPTYYFTADNNTGMYNPAADQLGFVAGGIEAGRFNAAAQLRINAVAGVAPLAVSSDTLVGNLNADMLDNRHATEFLLVNSASQIGQVLFTTDGVNFTVQLPLVDAGGWLVEEVNGVMLVVDAP